MRTVMAFEAHWVKRGRVLGPVYRGMRVATLQSRIVAIARSFNDLLTPAPGALTLGLGGYIGGRTLEKIALTRIVTKGTADGTSDGRRGNRMTNR